MDTGCPRCGCRENLLHVLRDCYWNVGVWKDERSHWRQEDASYFREWMAWVMTDLSLDKQEVFVMITWLLWKARNMLIFQNEYSSQEVQRCLRWTPPSDNEIKINFDASINLEWGRVGVGVVAKDAQGEVMYAVSRTISQPWEAKLGEATAALMAVEAACEQGWRKVVIEGDAQTIIRSLNLETMRGGHVQLMVEDILNHCQNFEGFSCKFFYRSCNEVAHRLVK
ncbi:hypothetical protein RDABS01_019930 [Bienertia sinuspersici]